MSLGTDPHSYANFLEAVITHLELDLALDFGRKIVTGHVDLSVKALKNDVALVSLDAVGLNITSVTDKATGSELKYEVEAPSELSQQLKVFCSFPAQIRIQYSTTKACKALQWLEAQQTKGKKHPLMFSQCQAICARTLFPCQDTPAVKMPFAIKVTAPLPLVAVASGKKVSAVVDKKKRVTTFSYEQSIPVMSYLVAIICGNLENREVGPRSSIWTEPEIADAAQMEMGGVLEKFIVEAENICGSPYIWGAFDVAVLPQSFAYGGMENPNITFFSSSLLTGDRSLLTTLAHEITHSWSGNLVTNARWKDFWLNEGFTRYIERRILGAVHGEAFRGLVLAVGYNDLVKTVDMLTSTGSKGLTCLNPEIVGIDPDHAFSRVPYEKGSLFLHYLEQVVGGEAPMTEWLTAYIHDFKEKSIETQHFMEHFSNFFKAKDVDLSGVDWQHWIKGEGLPSYELAKHTNHTLLDGCLKLAETWLAGGKALMRKPTPEGVASTDLEGKKAQEIMLFLDHLINAGPGAVPADRLNAMDSLYHLSDTGNVEVGFRWALLNLKNEHRGVFPTVAKYLACQGRGSYVKPIYIALNALDHDFAVSVFRENEHFYQKVISEQLRKILNVSPRIDLKVNDYRKVESYLRSAETALKEMKHEVRMVGKGRGIGVASLVATEAEQHGWAMISKIETGLTVTPENGSAARGRAQISIVLRPTE